MLSFLYLLTILPQKSHHLPRHCHNTRRLRRASQLATWKKTRRGMDNDEGRGWGWDGWCRAHPPKLFLCTWYCVDTYRTIYSTQEMFYHPEHHHQPPRQTTSACPWRRRRHIILTRRRGETTMGVGGGKNGSFSFAVHCIVTDCSTTDNPHRCRPPQTGVLGVRLL